MRLRLLILVLLLAFCGGTTSDGVDAAQETTTTAAQETTTTAAQETTTTAAADTNTTKRPKITKHPLE